MLADNYTFNVTITKKCGEKVTLSTLAQNKWEAEDKTHTRFEAVQPDRGAYSATRAKVNKMYVNRGVL